MLRASRQEIAQNPSLGNLPCTPRVVQSAQTALVLAAKLNNIELADVESTEVGL
jgi:hypothetical protein